MKSEVASSVGSTTNTTGARTAALYSPAPDIRLRITPEGRVLGLWTDAIDFTALGQLRVTRASHVEFDSRRQRWCVRAVRPMGWWRRLLSWCTRDRNGPILFKAVRRADALAWEIAHFGPGGPGWIARSIA